MDQTIILEKYPVYVLRLQKAECAFKSVDEVVDYFLAKIEQHPITRLIGIFDHYAHTKALAEGEIMPDIQAAKNIVFCFGTAIPAPEILALRPRSIGVVELPTSFVVSFLEAPMPIANTAMEGWAQGLRAQGAAGE